MKKAMVSSQKLDYLFASQAVAAGDGTYFCPLCRLVKISRKGFRKIVPGGWDIFSDQLNWRYKVACHRCLALRHGPLQKNKPGRIIRRYFDEMTRAISEIPKERRRIGFQSWIPDPPQALPEQVERFESRLTPADRIRVRANQILAFYE